MKKVFIGLGTNLGEKILNLTRAVDLIKDRIGPVLKESSYYRTPPWGFDSTEDFINQVILVECELTPDDLLKELKRIESEMGRKQRCASDGYKDRLIDLDIIDFNGEVIDDPNITVPHAHLADRDFVLVPLNEIAEKWKHPRTNSEISDVLKALGNTSNIEKI